MGVWMLHNQWITRNLTASRTSQSYAWLVQFEVFATLTPLQHFSTILWTAINHGHRPIDLLTAIGNLIITISGTSTRLPSSPLLAHTILMTSDPTCQTFCGSYLNSLSVYMTCWATQIFQNRSNPFPMFLCVPLAVRRWPDVYSCILINCARCTDTATLLFFHVSPLTHASWWFILVYWIVVLEIMISDLIIIACGQIFSSQIEDLSSVSGWFLAGSHIFLQSAIIIQRIYVQ